MKPILALFTVYFEEPPRLVQIGCIGDALVVKGFKTRTANWALMTVYVARTGPPKQSERSHHIHTNGDSVLMETTQMSASIHISTATGMPKLVIGLRCIPVSIQTSLVCQGA